MTRKQIFFLIHWILGGGSIYLRGPPKNDIFKFQRACDHLAIYTTMYSIMFKYELYTNIRGLVHRAEC